MCDVCPKNDHVPVYTISIFTGERLSLCLDCADNKAEPLWTIIHGVNAGALDGMPEMLKASATFFRGGRYWPMRTLAKAKVKALPSPPVETREDIVSRQLVKKMKEVAAIPFEPVSKDRRLFLSSLRQTMLDFGRHVLALRNGAPVRA